MHNQTPPSQRLVIDHPLLDAGDVDSRRNRMNRRSFARKPDTPAD